MANLRATAHTPVGSYTGKLNGAPSSREDLEEARDAIQKQLNTLGYLVLYSTDDKADVVEVTLPGELVKNSVFIFKVEE